MIFGIMSLRVLYEDNHLIAVYKLAGVLVQGDETGDRSLLDEVKGYLKEKYQKPGNVFLGLLHRLDRPVSGIVLFAKTSKGASRLSEQFRDHAIEKIYHAIVEGKPKKDNATLVHYLKKNAKNNIVTAYADHEPGTFYAELSYDLVRSNSKYSLLQVKLKTGRPHQIRAQLSIIGCPLVGDIKYGAKKMLKNGDIALCATSLSFKLATKEEVKHLVIDLPKEWRGLLTLPPPKISSPNTQSQS